MGEYGILENFVHSILSLEDVQSRDFNFLRIKNYWGSETNWSGPFSKNSDEWDKYKNLREEFVHNNKYNNDDKNVYFMKYEYFIREFNRIYIVQLFDDKNWKSFCHASLWRKLVVAGAPADLSEKFPISK